MQTLQFKISGEYITNLLNLVELGLNVPPFIVIDIEAAKHIFNTQSISDSFLTKYIDFFQSKNIEKIFVRSFPVISLAGIYKTVESIPINNKDRLKAAILTVINSWINPIAVKIRDKKNISHNYALGIVLQAEIDPTNGGASAIIYSANPNDGDTYVNGVYVNGKFGVNLANAMEEHFFPLGDLSFFEQSNFEKNIPILEKHNKFPIDSEWVKDPNGVWYIVQYRDLKMSPIGLFYTIKDLHDKRIIEKTEVLNLLKKIDPNKLKYYKVDMENFIRNFPNSEYSTIFSGETILEGFVKGYFTNEDLSKGDILYSDFTNTKQLNLIRNVKGLIAKWGNVYSHEACLARDFKVPSIVGVGDLDIADGTPVTLVNDYLILGHNVNVDTYNHVSEEYEDFLLKLK